MRIFLQSFECFDTIPNGITQHERFAEKLEPSKVDQIDDFIDLVKKEGDEILATLKGLQDEIEELQRKGNKLKKGDLSLEDLEKKLQKRLNNWKNRQEKSEEVSV